jgi:GNAT superfamily N-acetyltransferase
MSEGVRRATAHDYEVFAALVRELGLDDPAPSAERFAADIAARTLIYDRSGAAAGYVVYDQVGPSGYIRNLVVAPAARRRGIGAALMLAAAEALRARGVTDDWHLNVKVDNAAAIRLYEQLGMRVRHRSIALRWPWASLDQLPVDDAPVAVLPVSDGDDDDLERGLGILAGRLAMARSRGPRVTVQLRDRELAPVGVACFDPAFPGTFVFYAARPTLAAPLLRALAPHARPGDRDLQIVIEDNDPLADALIAAGGDVRLQLLHFAGPLPGVARV